MTSAPFGQLPKVEGTRRRDEVTLGRVIGLTLLAGSLFWPRLFILGLWIFGSLLGQAYSSWVIPAAGFLIAPWTTATYALMWGSGKDAVAGFWEWAAVGVAIALDLATWWGISRLRR
jgi:hypothetical protein